MKVKPVSSWSLKATWGTDFGSRHTWIQIWIPSWLWCGIPASFSGNENKAIWGGCENEITQCASRAWYNQAKDIVPRSCSTPEARPFISRSCLQLFIFSKIPHLCSRWPKSMRACMLNYEKCINIYNILCQINQVILHLDLGRNEGMALSCAIILSCVNFVPSLWL